MSTNDKLKLYLRLPIKIKEELDVKNLHPDIYAVHIPRQKGRRWCFIDFKDQDTLRKVRSHLKKIKIGGKKLLVLPYTFAGTKRVKRKQQKVKKSKVEVQKVNTSVEPLLDLLKKQE